MVNSIYLTIMHETGHTLRLQRLAVPSNIMSCNHMPRTINARQAALAMFAATFIGLGYPEAIKHTSWFMNHADVRPYAVSRPPMRKRSQQCRCSPRQWHSASRTRRR